MSVPPERFVMNASKSLGSGVAALTTPVQSLPYKSGNTVAISKQQIKVPTTPSFLSPEPARKPENKLTLSDQPARKIKSSKHPLGLPVPCAHANKPDKKTKTFVHKLKHRKRSLSMSTRVLEDISNKRYTGQPSTLAGHDPTRKLEFSTPIKLKTTCQEEPVQSSSSSSFSSSSDDQGYSSDEAEVTFDATTIGNMRVVRESLSQSPALSSASSASGMAPVGLEYHFSVSSTVSSVAVAPDGTFLVVGFYNGMVYLYPLTKDSLLFRRGVLLDQIMPRGMYTQIMVTVIIPQDGKFIFAGVYRGSTDIRAFEVDSITFPSPSDPLQSTSERDDDDVANSIGIPTAKVIAHTYSDAKLKGFAAAKSVYLQGGTKTEYRLLCGLGIKNVHMWRFYQCQMVPNEWTWECIFDKQTNGISLELIMFHPTIANQFLSKSEHQNLRIWHLDEDYEASTNSVIVRKKSHTDIKQTVDIVAVYGDYAYGGSDSLAVVDLYAATRMELDLPLSAKEQRAQRDAALMSRNATSLRAWNPRGNRRRGVEDMSAQRHMRTVSKLAGQNAAPFTVGMCTDGSVFYHSPKPEIGLATPLEYIEGYEHFFVDPSLDFQAQFSDLTRVNTSGLLSVLPLSTTDKEKWMIVAANQDQLVVRSLNAFLHCNQQNKEYSQVKSDLKNVVRDLGGATSSVESSDSDKSAMKDMPLRHKKVDMSSGKRVRLEIPCSTQELERKRSRHEKNSRTAKVKKVGEMRKVVPEKAKKISTADEIVVGVTTPLRRKLSTSTVSSPVVSISSSSSSSNPATPIHSHLSRYEAHVVASKELQWTPPSTIKPEGVTDAATHLTQLSSRSDQVKSGKKSTHRIKAQALFADRADGVMTENRDEGSQTLDSQGVTVIESAKGVKQAEPAEEDEAGLDEQLEKLEQYEPKFLPVPFVSDKSSLLAATMYQYDTRTASSTDVLIAEADDTEVTAAATEQTNLLMQFAHQNERLRMNFLNDRERIYRHPDCSCALHARKTSTSAMNWRRGVAHDYLKRKQLHRRHKKQLAIKLQQLHANYAVQIQELFAVQQMQANALRTRQQFQHLHCQLCHDMPSSTTASSPIKIVAVPDHLSGTVFPYPNLFT